MKHYFIINPVAGIKNGYDLVANQVKEIFTNQEDYVLYKTKKQDDAYYYVKDICDDLTEEAVFYACGGDGTMYEVVNGIANCDKARMAIVPIGSCNDFLKEFKQYDFLNIKSLVEGVVRPIDVIKVNGLYSINVANAGFDARVNDDVTRMALKYKNVKRAYSHSIVKNLLRKLGEKVVVKADDENILDGKILLMAFANGGYYGGGYHCAPHTILDDGLMEVIIVPKLSRFKFVGLVKYYKKGEHLDNPRFKKYINYCRAKKVVVESEKPLCFCLDGETVWDTHFELEVLPRKIKMVFPKE